MVACRVCVCFLYSLACVSHLLESFRICFVFRGAWGPPQLYFRGIPGLYLLRMHCVFWRFLLFAELSGDPPILNDDRHDHNSDHPMTTNPMIP